jgi:exonuclease III
VGCLMVLKLTNLMWGRGSKANLCCSMTCGIRIWEKNWSILNVYGAPHDEGKDKFPPELATFCSRIRVPYIVGGDFNIVRFPSDKNRNFHPNGYTDTLNAVIHVNELRELDISRGKFTWSNNQVNSTLEKLDMLLMSRNWELIFPATHVYKVPRGCSDHNPLFLTTSYNTSTSFREF